MIKRVFSVIVALAICICAISVSAFAEGLIELPEVTLYALREQAAENGVKISDDYAQSYQISVESPYDIYYAVADGISASVSKKGLVTPKYANVYWHDGVCTSEPTGEEGEYSEKVPVIGTTKVIVNAGPDNYSINVEVRDYAEIYAKQSIEDYVNNSFNDEMSDYVKLSAIADFVSSFDYSAGNTTVADMFVSGNGNIAVHTEAILMLCKQAGINAWERSTAKDEDKTASTNIVAQTGNELYSFTSSVEGSSISYTVDEKGSLFSYTSVETAAEIYQYDGNPEDFDGVLDIPSEIDGKTVTSIAANAFYKCNSVT